MDAFLTKSVKALPGVGEKRAAQYQKLGIFCIKDLLFHFPRAYENRGDVVLLADTQSPERRTSKQATVLTVSTQPRVARLKNRMSLLKFRAFDDSGVCEIAFFNQEYLSQTFPIGATFRFFGKVESNGSHYTMTGPAFEPWSESCELAPLFPVYPLTDGLSNKMLMTHLEQILPMGTAHIEDPLPDDVRMRHGLCTLAHALRNIHRPPDYASLQAAKTRLAFDEFFRFALALGRTGRKARTQSAPSCVLTEAQMREFLSVLPYALTGAQRRVLDEIRADMAASVGMNRILVGDVGCGKTVCAAAAMFIAIRSGRQAALMAPTGILAAQHAADLLPLFARLGIHGALLLGSTPASQKKKIYAALAADPAEEGTPHLDFVIGTQALLSEGVCFARPGLVITDEQHRFGVHQRAVLSEKNRHAHLLVMSATPIPRSLALMLYGDLDVSRIDEMPPGRQRVDTFVVDESYRARLDAFIRKNVADGGQVYVVCPAVEQSDEEEDSLIPLSADFRTPDALAAPTPPRPLKAAVQYADELAARLPELKVAFVHGKMKGTEKDRVMQSFAAGDVQILVSTTVIEVGVNVPNACLMLVENAERFGLSQLHQLRGRVGRGTRKSYCILVRDGGGEVAKARLEVMRTTYDGYQIAEQDLAQRGPGDFLAPSSGGDIRQSGGFRLRVAEGWPDATLMERAFAEAKALLEKDPTLQATPLLLSSVQDMFKDAGDILN